MNDSNAANFNCISIRGYRQNDRQQQRQQPWQEQQDACVRPCPCVPRSYGCSYLHNVARLELIGIHCKTHTAPRITPFKTSFGEDLIQSFFLCLLFNNSTSWNGDRLNAIGNFISFKGSCGSAKVSIRPFVHEPIKTQSSLIEAWAYQLQGPYIRAHSYHLTLFDVIEIQSERFQRQGHFELIRSPSNHRLHVGGVKTDLLVEGSSSVGNSFHSATALSKSSPLGI